MQRIVVAPGEKNPTHHISLSDGENNIGLIIVNNRGEANAKGITKGPIERTAVKTTSGNLKYGDFEYPWTPIAQDDWSGGRGSDDFEKDVTRYYDGRRANTMFANRLILGPQDTYGKGYRSQDFVLPGSVLWLAMVPGTTKYMAAKFTASASYTAAAIYMHVRRKGEPETALTIELCADSGGLEPSTVLQTASITTSNITDTLAEFYKSAITAQALTSGTAYWIKVYATAGDDENCWMVGVNNASGASKQSSNGTTWNSSDYDLYYRITAADTDCNIRLFEYYYMMYAVKSFNDGTTAPKLYCNGDRGVADSNSGALSTLVDASKSWVTDEWAGCVVRIVNGTGKAETTPWRVITGNSSTALTVSPDWNIAHDTTTEYVIVSADKWTEITGHGLTKPVTDVMVMWSAGGDLQPTKNSVFFCQGDDTNVRRMRWYNNSGTATYGYADDGSNKGTFMCLVNNTTATAGVWVYKATVSQVSRADPTDWGTDLSYGSTTAFWDSLGKITGLEAYGSPEALWILREGMIYQREDDGETTPVLPIPLREMSNLMESTNGQAHTPHNNYLYFNLGGGIERYYDGNLDDVGLNKDEGLPDERKGVVSYLHGYAGKYFAAVDAGDDGYSAVYGNNLTGWCELYRAPATGQRITAMQYQPIPGNYPDRLWVVVGNDIIWLHFPSYTTVPTQDSNYRYTNEASIETCWMYAGLVDIQKFYKSIKIFAEHLGEGQTIEVSYKRDDDTTWTMVKDVFDTSPMQEVNLLETLGVTGKRLRYRIVMRTDDNSITPIVKTVVIETVSRIPIKYSYNFDYRIRDDNVNLRGEPDEDVDTIQDMIDEWAANVTPLVMRSLRKRFDDKLVFIEPTPLTPQADILENYASSMTVIEI